MNVHKYLLELQEKMKAPFSLMVELQEKMKAPFSLAEQMRMESKRLQESIKFPIEDIKSKMESVTSAIDVLEKELKKYKWK